MFYNLGSINFNDGKHFPVLACGVPVPLGKCRVPSVPFHRGSVGLGHALEIWFSESTPYTHTHHHLHTVCTVVCTGKATAENRVSTIMFLLARCAEKCSGYREVRTRGSEIKGISFTAYSNNTTVCYQFEYGSPSDPREPIRLHGESHFLGGKMAPSVSSVVQQ